MKAWAESLPSELREQAARIAYPYPDYAACYELADQLHRRSFGAACHCGGGVGAVVTECPVCRRQVPVSEYTGRVRRHDDTADRTCPMSGHTIPIDQLERRAA